MQPAALSLNYSGYQDVFFEATATGESYMRILHLETSSFFRKLVQKGTDLQHEDYFGCDSIAEAVQVLESQSIDLILTAQEMTDGTVENFLKDISEGSFKDIPIIMLSSSNDMELRRRYFELGVIDFISKDNFSIEKLKDQISVMEKQDDLTRELQQASIAIVDDSLFILKVVHNILSLQNIQNVDLYRDPRDLLASGKSYDIYMLDMFMPGMSGKQLTMALRNENTMAVIIIISSMDRDSTILQALEAGADDYILKPFNADLLSARIRSSFRSFILMRELEQKRREMEYLAVTDVLTGAKNRRSILQVLADEIESSKKTGIPFSVLLLDVDKFKSVNDTYGHPDGDIVLQRLSRFFLENCREQDSFGRYGGEEFLHIMSATPLEEALEISEKLRKGFNSLSFDDIDPKLVMSFSGGLAQWEKEDADTILSEIDNLLYDAKSGGRNNIQS